MSAAVRTLGYTFAASVGLHGVLLLLAAWLITVLPAVNSSGRMAIGVPVPDEAVETDAAELQEVAVTFLSLEQMMEKDRPKPPAPESPAPEQQGKMTIIARPDQPVLAPMNEDTPFISSQNMRAASKTAPKAGADSRLVNQDGVDLDGLSFTTASYSEGAKPAPAPAPAAPPANDTASLPDPVRSPDTPATPPPVPATEQRPPETNAVAKTNDPLAPAPAEKPAVTPALRERPPDTLSLSTVIPPRATARPAQPPLDPVSEAPAAGRPGSPNTVGAVKTKSEGSIAIRGDASSVDARDTPEGRYNNIVYERVGLLWNRKLSAVRGIAGIGTVEVEFEIDPKGRVSNVRLVDPGKANPVLEDVCLAAIINSKLPAPPASMQQEMSDPLTGGKLRRKFTFHRL